jgi:P4 family phage/plasmid primase-like protien
VSADTLPWLPDTWLAGIAAGEYVQRARAGIKTTRSAFAWINKRPDAKGEPCKMMEAALDKVDFTVGGAHDELTDKTYQVLALGVEGHKGASTAISRIGRAFIAEVAGNRRGETLAGKDVGSVRSKQEARAELERAIVGAVDVHLGHLREDYMVEAGLSEGSQSCSCWDAPAGEPGGAKDPYDYPLTDTGNAEQLIDLVDGSMVWVKAYDSWFAYDDAACSWARSNANLGMKYARMIAPRVQLAAEQRYESLAGLEQDSSDYNIRANQAKKLIVHADKCGSRSALSNMLDVAKSYDDMVVDAEKFDADPRLLHCADGKVIELNDDGARAREGRRDDYVTRSTGVPYVQGATDSQWTNYLDTFIPDKALLGYVQRLLGYGLLGGNPQRLLVFFNGPTSSGKSTILEAAGAAVGQYGGSFAMSVFKEKQDEGPRADLVRILDQRLAYASEAGPEWHLHADQLKKLTGGDSVLARLPHSPVFVEKVPAFTPFIATNNTPTIRGADEALWRRLIAVPFDVQAGAKGIKDDPEARDRLRTSPSALVAILAWLVRGWDRFRAEGLDDRPAAVVDRTNDMKSGVSDFHAWLEETFEVTKKPADSLPVADIYNRYLSDMVANGVRDVMTSRALSLALTAQGVPKPKKGGDKARVDGKMAAVRLGIKYRRR